MKTFLKKFLDLRKKGKCLPIWRLVKITIMIMADNY